MNMDRYEAMTTACNLYDGGWRAEDKEFLMDEYGISEEEAELLCEYLAEIESKQEEE